MFQMVISSGFENGTNIETILNAMRLAKPV